MICVNELSTQVVILVILEPLAIVISPYAPHIEELWSLLGNKGSIATVPFPVFEPKHLIERQRISSFFNGKCFTIELPLI
jgi:leucyl-tRNA synthetase